MKKRICAISLIIVAILAIGFFTFKFLPIGTKQTSTPDVPEINNDNTLIEPEKKPETITEITEPIEPTPPPTVEIAMVGDMLMHGRVMESGLKEDGSYNFDHLFANVKDTIENADLALVNQETILGGTELGLSGYPAFNSPYE